KLEELEAAGAIATQDEPTDWVNRMVVTVKKSGDIRICVDPPALNEALKRENHPLPTIDDILPTLTSAKTFARFDLNNGHWQGRTEPCMGPGDSQRSGPPLCLGKLPIFDRTTDIQLFFNIKNVLM